MQKIQDIRKQVVEGLIALPEDKRDIPHSRVFGAPPVDIPLVDFDVVKGSKIKDQYDTDFCAGFSSSSINEDIQQKTFDEWYQFSKIKQVMGDYTKWGADLRSACKALTKYGSLPKEKAVYKYKAESTDGKDRDFLANWTNWPKYLDTYAGEFKCGSYFTVDGGGDYFDNIRAKLYQNKDKGQGVLLGVLWRPEWTYVVGGVIPEATYDKPQGSGHAIKACGQKIINGVPYVKIQNSWGEKMGDKGFYYFPRSVINKEVAMFGAFMLEDMDAEKAKTYIAYNLTTQDGAIGMIVKIILSIFNDFKQLLK